MAAPVYSTLFADTLLTTAGAHTVYTVPAGFVAVLRDVDVVPVTASSNLYLGSLSSGFLFWTQIAPVALQSAEWRGRQVFNAGDGIVFTLTAAFPWAVRCSGYLLNAP